MVTNMLIAYSIILAIFIIGFGVLLNKTFLDYTVLDSAGKKIDLYQFRGKKILVVNTPVNDHHKLYDALSELYNKYHDRNFVILLFPSNDFDQAVILNDENKRSYESFFIQMQPICLTGSHIAPVYKWLATKKQNGLQDVPIMTNYQKFMIGRKGEWIGALSPDDDLQAVEDWLNASS